MILSSPFTYTILLRIRFFHLHFCFPFRQTIAAFFTFLFRILWCVTLLQLSNCSHFSSLLRISGTWNIKTKTAAQCFSDSLRLSFTYTIHFNPLKVPNFMLYKVVSPKVPLIKVLNIPVHSQLVTECSLQCFKSQTVLRSIFCYSFFSLKTSHIHCENDIHFYCTFTYTLS